MTALAAAKGHGVVWRRRRLMLVVLAWIFALLPGIASPCQAETTTKDILVAVRTLGFVVDPPVGDVPLAVVFDPTLPQSVAELRTVVAALDGASRIGAVTVHPLPVPVADLNRLTDFRFVLLVGGVQGYRQAIFEKTKGRGVVTISTDLDCVRAGFCVLGVAAQPRVQVLVNRLASQAAAVEFLVAFRMMITEL